MVESPELIDFSVSLYGVCLCREPAFSLLAIHSQIENLEVLKSSAFGDFQ
jgi:hypothetical protein